MKKFAIVILCLAFASLACLSTSSAVIESNDLAVVATRFEIGQSQTPAAAAAEPTLTISPQLCARVVAIDALHLRKGPSADDIVLTWLRSGDVVQLLDQLRADWWRVEFKSDIGFARSIFLEEVECVK